MIRIVDHLLVLLLVVVAPIGAAWSFRALIREIRAGHTGARLRDYRLTVILQWFICLAALAWWFAAGRGAAAIGLTLPLTVRTVVGLVATAVGLGLILVQWRTVSRLEGEALAPLRAQVDSVRELLPHTPAEYRQFRKVAITAGICEEVLYRGFLMWYLAHWMPGWAAALAGGALFGIAHLYQGGAGVLKTGTAGILSGLLFAGTGSLLWPMVLHAALDLQGGAIARKLLAAVPQESP